MILLPRLRDHASGANMATEFLSCLEMGCHEDLMSSIVMPSDPGLKPPLFQKSEESLTQPRNHMNTKK